MKTLIRLKKVKHNIEETPAPMTVAEQEGDHMKERIQDYNQGEVQACQNLH